MVELLSNSAALEGETLKKAWRSAPSVCLISQVRANQSETFELVESIPGHLGTGHYGIFTSGSTGKPRLVIGSKERSERLVSLVHEAQMGDEVAETICALPISYSYAFVNQWLWAHVMNRRFVPTPGFSQPDVLVEALRQADAAMICLVASQIPLFRQYFDREVFAGVIRVNFAGERFPQQDLSYIREIFPNAEVFNNYGCTEAMPRLTVRHAGESDDAANVGRPLPGIELQADAEGRLLFRSPFGAVASIGSEGVRHFAPDDWIETGDFAEPAPDGTWRLKGRTNEVFKRYGEKVSIARVVGDLHGAWDGAILGYADDDPNGDPAWVLVLSPVPDKAEVRKLLLFLRERYTRPHWPIRIESLERIPELPNGKADVRGIKDAENKNLHWRQRI